VVPRWPEGSLGERLGSGAHLARARSAPSLITAEVPDATVILGDPAHWSVAAGALIRAVVYDGLRAGHPAVSALAGVLAPIAGAELAYDEALEDWYNYGDPEEEDKPEFPELDGPVFLIGTCALADATSAVIGADPLTEVHPALAAAMDDVIPGLAGRVVADALLGAAATHHQYDRPGDASVLKRANKYAGNALEDLVGAGAVPGTDVIRAGLAILAALAELGRSGSSSIRRPAA
jgi:hypothetical protein